jgi:putative transposase
MGSQYTSDLFHGILKREEVNLRTYQDYYTAKNALFDFIEGLYNRNQLHGSLGYKTPQEVEDECKSKQKK